jgi:hypothetical protein
MKTDQLVDDLVADLKPVRTRNLAGEAGLLALLVVVEFGVFRLFGMGHAHMGEAMASMPSFLWKLASLAILALVSVVVALRSLDPARSSHRGLGVIAALVALILLAGWVVDATTVHATRPFWQRLEIADGLQCMLSILILSIPPIVLLGWLMRRAAPTDLRGSALAVGIAGAALGAFLFVFACPHSDPFYVAVWFVLGCAMVAIIGRLALPRINRW